MNAIASAACPPLAAQTVLVTGGARGLGRAISEAFLAQGARVLINCLHSLGAEPRGDGLAGRGQFHRHGRGRGGVRADG